MNVTSSAKSWIVTRYIDGELTTYIAHNWGHVSVLLGQGKIVNLEEVDN